MKNPQESGNRGRISQQKEKMESIIEKEKTTMTPSVVTLGMATLEELSNLLAAQTSDQERYALAERIIIDQITHRDNLLERIKTLEQELTASRKSPDPVNRLDTSNFILQIPGMKENYRPHLEICGEAIFRSGFD